MTLKTLKTLKAKIVKIIKTGNRQGAFHNPVIAKSNLNIKHSCYRTLLPQLTDSSHSMGNYLDLKRQEEIIEREINEQGYINILNRY